MSSQREEIHEKLKTAYQLARAATATEEGRKAIDFFYHVHLNSYPGFATSNIKAAQLLLISEIKAAVLHEFELGRSDDYREAMNIVRTILAAKRGEIE